MAYSFNITLFRDSLQTPWGFRLEGGREFATPLTIQRVFTGSPASSDLQRGDTIASINGRDGHLLYHQEAHDMLRNSGGSVQLGIRRAQGFLGQQTQSYSSRPAYYTAQPISVGINPVDELYLNREDPFSTHHRSSNIEKKPDPRPVLSQTGSPFLPTHGNFTYGAVSRAPKRYRPASTQPIVSSGSSSYSPYSLNQLPRTNFGHLLQGTTNNQTAQPYGFDSRMASQLQHTLLNKASQRQPVMMQTANVNTYTSSQSAYSPLPQQPIYNEFPYHSQQAAGADPFDSASVYSQVPRRPGVLSPQGSTYRAPQPRYNSDRVPNQQHKFSFGDANASQAGPKLVNNQFNTPIGLYSNKNIQEEIFKKIGTTGMAPSSDF